MKTPSVIILGIVLFSTGTRLAAVGLVDHVRLDGDRPVSFIWHFGDRVFPVHGVQVDPGASLSVVVTPDTGRRLTLEVREFRLASGQSPAYLVALNGKDIAFRCRHYDEAGLSSAFIDLPDTKVPLALTIRNLAPHPLCLSEVFLYEDIEQFARTTGLMQPMFLGPTIRHVTRKRLETIKGMIPSTNELAPLAVVATFAIAQWPPERVRQRLRDFIRVAGEAGVPLTLHVNTWWAGTPFGFDGRGGRWCDPEYQQVTFDPITGQFGLSIPNAWSSVPWLTTRHPRLNTFKAGCFRTFGQLMRPEWDRFTAASPGTPFPIHSLVMDNEVTYWGAGNPGTPSTLEADFNPAIVAAAKKEGIDLDPRNGLDDAEIAFLRRSLRHYNREMAAALLDGLGSCPLEDRIYTHTFMRGWCFDNPIQATEVGILDTVRLGAEWGEVSTHGLEMLDIHRELGVPVDINCELGGVSHAEKIVNLAYAAGCSELDLFNLSDTGLQTTMKALSGGWSSFPPRPWRPVVFHEDFNDPHAWSRHIAVENAHIEGIGKRRALIGHRVGTSSFARLRVGARELVGTDTFDRLCLNLDARAFLYRQTSSDSYLAIRVGSDANNAVEVARLTNMAGSRRIDLTPRIAGKSDLYVEFEFHPLGLPGWVALFKVDLEIPWAEESLLATNRSYRADRLRAESLIVARRSEKRFPRQPGTHRHVPYPFPPANRTEQGEACRGIGSFVVFDPYQGGCMRRHIPVAKNCRIFLDDDGTPRNVSGNAILGGDDLTIRIRRGQAVEVRARRRQVRGPVLAFEPATPFRLARLHVEGAPAMRIDSRTTVHGRIRDRKPASCPLVPGSRDFQPGDIVDIRWNPTRRRIVAAALATP